MNLLITGGAGYIGSHVARQLSEQGDSVTVFDNLSTGSREALLYSEKLIHADLTDEKALTDAVSNGRFDPPHRANDCATSSMLRLLYAMPVFHDK